MLLTQLSGSVHIVLSLFVVIGRSPRYARGNVNIKAGRFLEKERALISQRTKAALAAAKARGQTLGNPKLAEARAIANANHTAGADAFADSVAPAIREARAAGAKTLREIAAALNGRGIATARGGKWAPQAVANVLRRRG